MSGSKKMPFEKSSFRFSSPMNMCNEQLHKDTEAMEFPASMTAYSQRKRYKFSNEQFPKSKWVKAGGDAGDGGRSSYNSSHNSSPIPSKKLNNLTENLNSYIADDLGCMDGAAGVNFSLNDTWKRARMRMGKSGNILSAFNEHLDDDNDNNDLNSQGSKFKMSGSGVSGVGVGGGGGGGCGLSSSQQMRYNDSPISKTSSQSINEELLGTETNGYTENYMPSKKSSMMMRNSNSKLHNFMDNQHQAESRTRLCSSGSKTATANSHSATASVGGGGNGVSSFNFANARSDMNFIMLIGLVVGLIVSKALQYLQLYFSWFQNQVLQLRNAFLGPCSFWDFINFDDNTRYGIRTKILLMPLIGTCSLLYGLVALLHFAVRFLLTQAPNGLVSFIYKLYNN